MSVCTNRVPTRAALNMPLIRERVAALGLVDGQVRTVIGTDLYKLGRDPDARAVSLTMLVRLSRLLEVPLDDLVVTDDYLLLGLIATFNGRHIVRIFGLLGWTRSQLDAALVVIGEHLAPTALRVVATDERLTLTLRPTSSPR